MRFLKHWRLNINSPEWLDIAFKLGAVYGTNSIKISTTHWIEVHHNIKDIKCTGNYTHRKHRYQATQLHGAQTC